MVFVSPAYASTLDAKSQGLAHYIMATYHDFNGDTNEAIAEYQKSIRYNDLEIAPRLKLGAYFLRLDEDKMAVVQFKAATRIAPRDAEIHYLLALAYTATHQLDLAAREYELILKLASKSDPASVDSHVYLGQLYYSESKFEEAIEQFLLVTSKRPDDASAWFLLGSVYADDNEHAKAIEIFKLVLRLDPQDSEAMNSLGYIYAEDNIHLDEAIQLIQKAISLEANNGAFYDSLGWALFKKGRYVESLTALKKAQSFIQDDIITDHIKQVLKAMNHEESHR